VIGNRPARGITAQLQNLFADGTCTGVKDEQLLARFLAGRDESGEQAFQVLVTRHGPMVVSVCRKILDDPADVHDAFQAVFMVLANRAGSIRNRESIGSWLYGVAIRVASRVRATRIRRAIRDRRVNQVAESLAAADSDARDESSAERNDSALVVHQELNRLPDKYRAPIVLCYLEGLTHDEAAAQLSWPVGTVRSRLSRGRDRLRDRLSRRGVTGPAVLAPLAGDPIATTVSSEVAASVARVASLVWQSRTATALAGVSSSIRLADGVLRAMMFKKLIVAVCVLVSLGSIGAGGGIFLVRRTHAQDPEAPETRSTRSTPPAVAKAPEVDPLIKRLIEAARARLDAQRAYYEEGRITIDRYVDAASSLQVAELLAATTDAERLAIKNRHLELLKAIENREKTELAAGRGTIADVSEATLRVVQAEVDLKQSEREIGERNKLIQRLTNLEQRVEILESSKLPNGR
jgi:RNA polymerase sigma factor (sigma-70 family)